MSERCSIGVALLPKLLPGDWSTGHSLAIVIDTLRFTSTATVALNRGARLVHVVSDIEQARDLASHDRDLRKLCGERHCVRIPGFDFGNSPEEYTAQNVVDKELIFSTTNGTFAVEAAMAASDVWLGSLLNRRSLCERILQWCMSKSDATSQVWCICAGTDGEVANEDVLTAGAIVDCLMSTAVANELARDCTLVRANDSAGLARSLWQAVADRPNQLGEQLKLAAGGRNLIEAGFEKDLVSVAQLDSLTTVPAHHGSRRFLKLAP